MLDNFSYDRDHINNRGEKMNEDFYNSVHFELASEIGRKR